MTAHRDVEFTEYVSARLPALRRLALLLCQDLHRADDLVQAALIKLYLHWTKQLVPTASTPTSIPSWSASSCMSVAPAGPGG